MILFNNKKRNRDNKFLYSFDFSYLLITELMAKNQTEKRENSTFSIENRIRSDTICIR